MTKVLFKEEQRFRQWWYVLMLLGVTVPLIVFNFYTIIQQAYRGIPVGEKPAPTWYAIVSLLVCLFFLSFAFVMKLAVWIDNEGIHYLFFPLFFRERLITVSEIRKFEIRKYNPLGDYGGWGMKRSFKWGRAYNVSGNIGLQLYLTNGKKVLFGTQKPQAIAHAMNEIISQ